MNNFNVKIQNLLEAHPTFPTKAVNRTKQQDREVKKQIEGEENAEDRCKRKADKSYGKKNSLYKGGAIAKCRQGKIWKK